MPEKTEDKCRECVDLEAISWPLGVKQLGLFIVFMFGIIWSVSYVDLKTPSDSSKVLMTVIAIFSFAELAIACRFITSNIIGTRLYFWLDRENHLHVHDQDWWLSFNSDTMSKVAPAKVMLELWFGGWFRKSRILIRNRTEAYWTIQINYPWFGFPRFVTFNDTRNNEAIKIRFAHELCGKADLATYELTRALQAISTKESVGSILIAANDLHNQKTADKA